MDSEDCVNHAATAFSSGVSQLSASHLKDEEQHYKLKEVQHHWKDEEQHSSLQSEEHCCGTQDIADSSHLQSLINTALPKTDAAGMFDFADEYDGLAALSVQFEADNKTTISQSETGRRENTSESKGEASSKQRVLRKRHPHLHQLRVDIDGDTHRQWQAVGKAQGLHSDTQIASFLLQHYQSTKGNSSHSAFCISCHASVSVPVFCANCALQNASSLSQTTATDTKSNMATEELPKTCRRTKLNSESKLMTATTKVRKKCKNTELDSQTKVKTVTSVVCKNRKNSKLQSVTGTSKVHKHHKKREVISQTVEYSNNVDCNDGNDNTKKVSDKVLNSVMNAAAADDDDDNHHRGDDDDDTDGFMLLDVTSDIHSDSENRESAAATLNDSRKDKQRSHSTSLKNGNGRLFACKECKHTYTRAGSLKVHMRKHTGEKPFECGQCGATFSLSGSLAVHKRTHSGQKPFICHQCGASFSMSSALKQHARTHSGEKPYKCSLCSAAYSRSDSLKVHMRSHSGYRPFICEECGASFGRRYCLIAHKKKHTGERPYRCEECGATFAQSGKLTIHMRKHTGARPFQCEICGASFAQSDRLKTHMYTHTGYKPFQCSVCLKSFSHPHSLKVHKRIHSGDKPHKCGVCGLSFADPSYFRRHKAKHAAATPTGVEVVSTQPTGSSVSGVTDVVFSGGEAGGVSAATLDTFSLLRSAFQYTGIYPS